MFETMRRKRRSTTMKSELNQGVDHFKRAAALAAQETGASVGPRFYAARDRVQPAAVKAKDAASSSWDTALATITPLVAAATETMRQSGKETVKVSKQDAKAHKKNAKRLEKRANQALGRKQAGGRSGKLVGLALIGAVVGAGAAFAARRRKAAQWDEYDPSEPITSTTTQPVGADDAAYEPAGSVAAVTPDPTPVTTEPVTTTDTDLPVVSEAGDQTTSALHSPKVARMASGKNGSTQD